MRALLALSAALALASTLACSESDRSAGVVEGPPRDPAHAVAKGEAQAAVAPAGGTAEKQILFGDLHVHSTFSIDAFLFALPLFGGEGVHPPADACDFARWCSDLDFFSLNDHAEGLFPERWQEIKESIRACNARAGDPANPDLVAFLGWEWTQAGRTPETHYGHKNVIFRETAEDRVPTRPITSLPDGTPSRARAMGLVSALQWLGPLGLADVAHFLWVTQRIVETPDCPHGVPVRELPVDCRENAQTPDELFEKLAQWGFDTLVIPHGLAWGIHAPPGARLDAQLAPGMHDPSTQRLIEVFSGHGNSEEFRRIASFAEGATDADGQPVCPEPTPGFLPCCWRAGELVRARCGDLPAEECEARVAEARRLALEAGSDPRRVLPDATVEDWLDCDQCRDCFKPAQSLRPGMTAQYAAALSRSDASGESRRFRFGFIASSDNHAARAGVGYKQTDRLGTTDARGFASRTLAGLARPWVLGRQQDPRRAQPVPDEPRGFRGLLDVERGASFMYPGGLVAVHADGRDRDAIWRALVRREVYGTSGPHILLWFDLENGAQGRVPMGGETVRATVAAGGAPPRFEVRAVGAFEQQPGCPEETLHTLSPDRLEHLCRGECFHPSDRRHRIEAIEVVRIRPGAGGDVADRIEDPWRRLACPPDPEGCVVHFDDPGFGEDTVYYVRALQEPTPAVNADGLRTRFDARGRAVSVDPCYADWRTPADDDCLAPARERAWSSPIYVDAARAARPQEPPPAARELRAS